MADPFYSLAGGVEDAAQPLHALHIAFEIGDQIAQPEPFGSLQPAGVSGERGHCTAFGAAAPFPARLCEISPVHLLIAPDKLRGTYTAAEAAQALRAGWLEGRPGDEVVTMPLADGGEGTAAALCAAAAGTWHTAAVHDSAGRPIEARFALLDERTAAVDVASACGLLLVADLEPDPIGASSEGAGELIRAALDAGARTVIVGVGGTASTDGGEGLLTGLGDLSAGVQLVAALDVENPLLGAAGAAAVFARQKGADADQIAALEQRLAGLDLETAGRPGAGAGGGIGAMLMHLGAETRWGAELVMERTGFAAAVAAADVCITAEGRIDMQTLSGKVVARVAAGCRAAGVDCIAVGGSVEPGAAEELAGRGVIVHEQTDLRIAGRQVSNRYP